MQPTSRPAHVAAEAKTVKTYENGISMDAQAYPVWWENKGRIRSGRWVVVFPNGLLNRRCESEQEAERIAEAFNAAHPEMRRTGTHPHTCWRCNGVSWCNCGSAELEPLCDLCISKTLNK